MAKPWSVDTAVSEPSPGVFFVEGPASNWVMFTEPGGARFTLVDTGYPGDRGRLLASMAHIGRSLDDCAALLVTHAHSDHIGSAAFLAGRGVGVYAHAAELPNVRREITEQVTVADLGWRVLAPRVAPWAVHAIWAGGLSIVAVSSVRPLDAGVLASLPGGLEAVRTAGHTTGHTAYLCRASGVLAGGDVVISGHAVSPLTGPQLLPAVFHADPGGIASAVRTLAGLGAALLLPGHGPAWPLSAGLPPGGLPAGDYWPFGRRRS